MIRKNPTYQHWLDQHFASFETYLYAWVDEYSRDAVRTEFTQDPYLGYCVLKDWLENHEDPYSHIQKLLDYIQKPEVFIILILGMPGSGKTTTAYKICELLKDRYNIKQVAPMMEDGVLPDWIQWITDISKARRDDLVIVDEASIKNNARRASSRKNMEDLSWIPIGRHAGCKVLYLTQISATSDVNLTRYSNAILSKGYTTSAVGASEIERKHIAENPILQYLKPAANYAEISSEEKDWCVVTIHNSTFMCYLPKPSFMNDKLSKPYRRFIESLMTPELQAEIDSIEDDIEREEYEAELVKDIAMKWADFMRRDGQPAAVIKTELDIRGFRKNLQYWKEFTGEAKLKGDANFD